MALPVGRDVQVTRPDTTMAVATLDRSLANHPDLDGDTRATLTSSAGPLYLIAQLTESTARAGDLDQGVDHAQRQSRPRPLLVTDVESAVEATRNLDRLLRASPAINDTDLRTVILGQSRINHKLGQRSSADHWTQTNAMRTSYWHRRDLLRRTASEMRHVAALPSLPTGHPAVAQTTELLRYVRASNDTELPRRIAAGLAQNLKITGQTLATGLSKRQLLVRDHTSLSATWQPLTDSREEPAISTCARALRNHGHKYGPGSAPAAPVAQHGRTALNDQLHHSQPPINRPRSPGDGRHRDYEQS